MSQLLGQQWKAGNIRRRTDILQRVPAIPQLLERIIANANKEQLGGIDPSKVKASFGQFVEIYDAVRHFGEPKHALVSNLTPDQLCEFLGTIQDVWHIVATMRPTATSLTGGDFSRRFQLGK